MRLLTFVITSVIFPTALLAQSVTAESGDVTYHPAAGAPVVLTHSGLDSEPSLSRDGRLVVFVRATPGDEVSTPGGPREVTSLWVVGVDGSEPRMVLRGRDGARPTETLAAFRSPRFSPDTREVYFLSSAWVVSDAVQAVELASGEVRFVAAGTGMEVVDRGSYEGHLMVWQHRYFLGGGSYDWVWLIAPDGEEIGPIGETEGAVETFLELQAEGGF